MLLHGMHILFKKSSYWSLKEELKLILTSQRLGCMIPDTDHLIIRFLKSCLGSQTLGLASQA